MLELDIPKIDEMLEFEGGRLNLVEGPLLESVLSGQGS